MADLSIHPVWEIHYHAGRFRGGETTMVLQIIAKLTKGESVLQVIDGEEESVKRQANQSM